MGIKLRGGLDAYICQLGFDVCKKCAGRVCDHTRAPSIYEPVCNLESTLDSSIVVIDGDVLVHYLLNISAKKSVNTQLAARIMTRIIRSRAKDVAKLVIVFDSRQVVDVPRQIVANARQRASIVSQSDDPKCELDSLASAIDSSIAHSTRSFAVMYRQYPDMVRSYLCDELYKFCVNREGGGVVVRPNDDTLSSYGDGPQYDACIVGLNEADTRIYRIVQMFPADTQVRLYSVDTDSIIHCVNRRNTLWFRDTTGVPINMNTLHRRIRQEGGDPVDFVFRLYLCNHADYVYTPWLRSARKVTQHVYTCKLVHMPDPDTLVVDLRMVRFMLTSMLNVDDPTCSNAVYQALYSVLLYTCMKPYYKHFGWQDGPTYNSAFGDDSSWLWDLNLTKCTYSQTDNGYCTYVLS